MEDFVSLEWDSSFFGFPVAKILATSSNSLQLGRILSRLRQNTVLAYWMIDSSDLGSAAAAKYHGGVLVDRKLTYVMNLQRTSSAVTSEPSIVAEYGDKTASSYLEDLAVQSGRYSRFNIDPRISRKRFEEMYKIWIRRSVSGELAAKVLVVHGEGDSISAMITLGCKNGRGDIGLVAVHSRLQGRGYGTALMREGRRYFASKGYKHSQVVTQGNNVAACALYQKSGFVLENSQNVFHFWLR
ncbi:MAG: GNAT family N-acetyltransferase [Candidatus Binataceae bacterium]